MWTLVNRYGGCFGRFQSYEVADNYRCGLDDWVLWTVVRIDQI